MKKMPIGIDDFKELVRDYYYVDKTKFISEFLNEHAKVTLITRPRRFGKTLLMSMLYYYFSVEEKDETRNLFSNLKVSREHYNGERGRYPVIFLSLKGVQNKNWDMMYGSFKRLIAKEFDTHSYILKKDIFTSAEKTFYNKIVNLSAEPEDYQVSLLYLTEFLERYYNEKAVILIDEYDAPLQYAFDYSFYDDAIAYFKSWFNNSLKGNSHLAFAVMTGVLRIAKESIFSGLNNLEVDTVTTNKYGDSFGFNADEVNLICRDYAREHYEHNASKLMESLKYWYDGYKFGDVEIYNPWSVTNFFYNHCMAKPYWINTSGNGILKYLLTKTDANKISMLYKLLIGESVAVTLNESVIYDDISNDKTALLTMLLTTGYLTIDQVGHTYNRFTLKIPNEEIKQVYAIEILNHLLPNMGRGDFDDFFDALFTGNVTVFSNKLRQIIENSAGAFDTAGKECFYHGFMLGMIACFHPNGYVVESNRESGFGRFDLAIIPEDNQHPAVIMEFKRAESENKLAGAAKQGLQQIVDKNYVQAIKAKHINKILGYGISFFGKKIYVTNTTLK